MPDNMDIIDLREVCFCIYDSVSCVAGGRETGLYSELSLLQHKVASLVKRGILHSIDETEITPNIIKSAKEGDGDRLHFWTRMLFREAIDSLMNMAKIRAEA